MLIAFEDYGSGPTPSWVVRSRLDISGYKQAMTPASSAVVIPPLCRGERGFRRLRNQAPPNQ